MRLWKILPLLIAGCLLFGCNDASVSKQAADKPPVAFDKVDDPKLFLANYLQDLSGDRYMPLELFKQLKDRTRLPPTVALVKQHDTVAFLRWYYATDYLDRVQKQVDVKLKTMDYSLKILDVVKEDASEVLLITASGPVEHKKQLLAGEIKDVWQQIDVNRYEVTLSRGTWAQRVGVGREEGVWKLRLLGSGAAGG